MYLPSNNIDSNPSYQDEGPATVQGVDHSGGLGQKLGDPRNGEVLLGSRCVGGQEDG